jgi:phosphoribosylanthranilate isomerase
VNVEIKICGLTRPEDAALAARHGATRLGVILAWGPRLVTGTQAREIVDAARGIPVIGVVADAPADDLVALAERAGLSGLQLHEGGDPDLARRLRAAGLEVWRVAGVSGGDDLPELLAERARSADAVLVEPGRAARSGGLGVALDIAVARRAREALRSARMILAGGLTAESVREAIAAVGPDGVDVSSGVESAPGIKDPGQLIRFLENARDAGSASRPDP